MGKVVSVLIPTRNRPQLAIKAVKSVLAQTYRPIEIVVTDNSDTDQLGDMLASIGDERICYSKNPENIGPILNWRKALEIASGEYCLVLPDDDYLINPFYIEDAVQILANEAISLVIPDCILSYPRKKLIGTSGHSGFIKGQDFIRNGLHIPHIGNVFRKQMAQRFNAFHSNDILWSDIELWMKLLSAGDAVCYSMPSVLYLFHDDNIVFNMSRSQLIVNSRYIRSSVEAFADDELVSELVIRYLCTVDSISNAVDYEFISCVIKLNRIENKKFYMLAQFQCRSIKRKTKAAILKSLRALKPQ
jgi:glycosyltransferase involved in cell wall biosynthesis